MGSPDAYRFRNVSAQMPNAFVVKRTEIDAEELMAYVAARVAPYARIPCVEFIDAIPNSAAGKILRRALRDRAVALDSAMKDPRAPRIERIETR